MIMFRPVACTMVVPPGDLYDGVAIHFHSLF
jgi:hypothetical protein